MIYHSQKNMIRLHLKRIKASIDLILKRMIMICNKRIYLLNYMLINYHLIKNLNFNKLVFLIAVLIKFNFFQTFLFFIRSKVFYIHQMDDNRDYIFNFNFFRIFF